MTGAPCKSNKLDCPKRKVGCHAKCQPYLDWLEQTRKERVYTNVEKKRLDYMWDYNGRRKKR